jgi:hypothetical protein
LRSQHVQPTLHLAIAAANRRDPDHFRVVQLSVQYDHLHLIVEAQDKASLSSGMRSIAIRIARSVNTLVGRRGRFWADRWHGRALTSPRQVRAALVYVIANFRKHAHRRLAPGIDPFSSGGWFDGWQEDPRAPPARKLTDNGTLAGAQKVMNDVIPHVGHDSTRDAEGGVMHRPTRRATRFFPGDLPVSRPQTWLARVGWRRYGLLRFDEAPAGGP